MKSLFQSFSIIPILLLFITIQLFPQSKKPLDHTVYNDWKEVKNETISNNGEYVAFEINPQKGDGELMLYKNAIAFGHFQRGYKAAFAPHSNFVVYKIKPQFDTVRAKKLEKVKKDKLPKDSLGIFVFESQAQIKYPKLKAFKVAEKDADWIAILLEVPDQKENENDSIQAEEQDKEKKKKKGKKKEKEQLLVLLNPVTGDSVSFENVTKFALAEDGSSCAFIQPKKDSIDSVMVSVFDTKRMVVKRIIDTEGYAENIAVDEQGKQIAYTFSTDTAKIKVYELFYVDLKNDKPKAVLNAAEKKVNIDWSVSENGKIYFNEKGSELFFGVIPRPETETKDTLTDDEKVSLDIWNWNDPILQPHQLKEVKEEKKRSYTAVYFPEKNKAIQLGDENLERIKIDTKAKGKLSLAFNDKPYRKMLSWESSRYRDVYILDRQTGERKLILEKVASSISLSPKQNYVAWYNIADSSWNVFDINSNTSTNVTAKLDLNFYNEWNDVPNEAGPYGMAGWTEKEKLVIYDRFDLWLIDPSRKEKAEMPTAGEGRRNKLKFRYAKLDREERYLPENMLLSAFNEVNKQAGYFSLNLKNGHLTKLVLGDYYFRKILKAKEADQIIWRKESFIDYPDLYLSDLGFERPVQLSRANPQQADYNWGTTELVEWVSFNGDSLQGILVKPEDFDPNKKYPMLVYFYERSSSRLNVYYTPKPIRSVINWTYYASNGYLVFIPDIVYRTGYPGPSGYDCIVSGTQMMCERYAFIDRNNLGIQGQSWGGYQTAYIITQTDLYKAAMAGAPVSNMTSAYGGIRWGTGLSRAFQYEEGQSRIGATLWERRDLYILNSPIFFADQINTPLLMMHNDTDGAVPWYQGIEFFNALRRLEQPVWMLVYNKAPHNLKRRADMEDLTIRMQQFFDFYLKGAPEPVWMKYGIPAVDKGKEFGFGLDR
jgi:dipeptidyl aminopeptidase/acylaminoacyl peptidase